MIKPSKRHKQLHTKLARKLTAMKTVANEKKGKQRNKN